MSDKIIIEVIRRSDKEVIDTVETTEGNADRVERGMRINMDPQYTTRQRPA